MLPDKEITIYDIAEELKISPATVSRALNNNKIVKEKTRKLVQETATKLGYQANNFAKNIRTGKTKTIGVIVHELKNFFVSHVLFGIERICTQHGYDIIIAHSAEDEIKEINNAKNLFQKRVDGILVSHTLNTKSLSHFDSYIKKKTPIVYFDRVFPDIEYSHVVLDNFKGGYDITKHLLDQGCKKIMHVTADLNRNVYRERYEGYVKAMEDAHIKIKKDWVRVCSLTEEAGIQEAAFILKMKEKPDAIFVSNDFCAAIIMNNLKEAGIKIPEDIAITGFNNDAICKVLSPKLTSINYPASVLGELAAQRLMDLLDGKKIPKDKRKIVIEPTLIVRESSIKRSSK